MLTDSCDAGTPSCVEARPSSACAAVGRGGANSGPGVRDRVARRVDAGVRRHVRVGEDELKLAHVHVQLLAGDHQQPRVDPVPCLMPPVLIVAVLSALIVIHEST